MGPKTRSTAGAGRPSSEVLVLGKDSRSFLAAIRSLGRRGMRVHVAWHDPDSLALRSRYVAKTHDLPAPNAENGAWQAAFMDLIAREQFDWILPTNDPATAALFTLVSRKNDLSNAYLPSRKGFEIAGDKLATWELARSIGIPVPRQRLVARAAEAPDADGAIDDLGLPIVLKPRHAYAFGRKKWEHQVRKVRRAKELAPNLAALAAKDEVLLQENFIGDGIGVEILADSGDVLLAFQHRRVHEPPDGGGSSYRRSEALDPELLDATRKLARAMEYTGVAMFEFKRDPGDGSWVLIEINARFWGSLPLAVAAGADFPHALYRMCVEGTRDFPQRYRTGIFARNLWMDLGWVSANRRADRNDPTLCRRNRWEVAAEIANVLTLRERWDEWALDDPVPGIVGAARCAREVARIVRAKARAFPLRLRALRTRRSRRLRAALAGARRVLIVCKGNVCRSPFAEHYVRAHLTDSIEVSSAGYFRESDRACPVEAVAVARDHGVDLAQHRSAVLDRQMIAHSDVILVFDDENRRALRWVDPSCASRVHRIGLLEPDGPPDIRDPYGGTVRDFESSYTAIARAIDSLNGSLNGAR